jgi:hypothetical protein
LAVTVSRVRELEAAKQEERRRSMAVRGGIRIAAWAAGAAVALCALTVLVVRLAPQWLAQTAGLKDQARSGELGSARSALLVVLTAVIAVVGAYFTARTFGLNRRGQVTDRFTRAIDQLGSDARAVRLGGIYALERLAADSGGYHDTVVEVLCAFVRERGRRDDGTETAEEREQAEQPGASVGTAHRPEDDRLLHTPVRPPADVQAALSVVARMLEDAQGTAGAVVVDLSSANLAGAELSHAPFARARCQRIDLTKAHASGADFEDASLQDARLRQAVLHRANLKGANLRGADLRGAHLDGADLYEADLRLAHLEDTDLGTVRGLPGANVAKATCNQRTVWPDDFDWAHATTSEDDAEALAADEQAAKTQYDPRLVRLLLFERWVFAHPWLVAIALSAIPPAAGIAASLLLTDPGQPLLSALVAAAVTWLLLGLRLRLFTAPPSSHKTGFGARMGRVLRAKAVNGARRRPRRTALRPGAIIGLICGWTILEVADVGSHVVWILACSAIAAVGVIAAFNLKFRSVMGALPRRARTSQRATPQAPADENQPPESPTGDGSEQTGPPAPPGTELVARRPEL